MNKAEYKVKHQAARLLIQARFYTGGSYVPTSSVAQGARGMVWDIIYTHIKEVFGLAVYRAVFADDPLGMREIDMRMSASTVRYRLRHNSENFDRFESPKRGRVQ